MQGDIDTGLSGAVVLVDMVHIVQDILDAEGVVELVQVKFVEERGHALNALAQIGRHRSLAIALDTLILERHLHVGRGGAAVTSQVEGVTQLKFIRKEREFQFAGFRHLVDTGHGTAATFPLGDTFYCLD